MKKNRIDSTVFSTTGTLATVVSVPQIHFHREAASLEGDDPHLKLLHYPFVDRFFAAGNAKR